MPSNVGYYKKYRVVDLATGEDVVEDTFTLKLETDPFAIPALRAYADAASNGGFGVLAAALYEKIEELEAE